jgi:hypothetical protein
LKYLVVETLILFSSFLVGAVYCSCGYFKATIESYALVNDEFRELVKVEVDKLTSQDGQDRSCT